MSILFILLSALGLGGAIYLGCMLERRRERIRKSRFEGRESLSLDEIFEKFYLSSQLEKAAVIDVWNSTAEILNLDSGKLRPEDSFDHELAPVKGFLTPDELGDLTDFYKERWKSKHGNSNPPKISTLDQLVRALLESNTSKE